MTDAVRAKHQHVTRAALEDDAELVEQDLPSLREVAQHEDNTEERIAAIDVIPTSSTHSTDGDALLAFINFRIAHNFGGGKDAAGTSQLQSRGDVGNNSREFRSGVPEVHCHERVHRRIDTKLDNCFGDDTAWTPSLRVPRAAHRT
jgi:hypothetical protein